jgi:ubiquinone/menaquinone biosynthesis C-methylase UbiE
LIIGIDSSEQCIKEASLKTRGFKNIEFVSTSEMNLKNWGLKADLVILANVLHHVPNNERTAFVDMLAKFLLKSQGEVVVFEHNPLNFVTRLVVRFCPFDKGVQLLSRKSTRILFQNQHFQLLKQPFIVFFPKFLSFLRPLEKQLGWCPLGAQYLLYAKRMVKS